MLPQTLEKWVQNTGIRDVKLNLQGAFFMAFLFAFAALASCLPGVSSIVSTTVWETVAEGFLATKKMSEIDRLVYLGISIEKSEAEQFMSSLRVWTFPADSLPAGLQGLAGKYLLSDMEASQMLNAMRCIDISDHLGGVFDQEFEKAVKDGPEGEAFRKTFGTHGVDLGKLITYGKRRMADPALMEMVAKAEA
jgi:hypothetical protein